MFTLFPARKIITMNPSLPEANAVLVGDGRIIEVGPLDRMRPWLDAYPHRVDARFENQVITPGFIDPHLHPSMAAVLLPMHFITAMRWRLPWGEVPPTVTADEFDARLAAKLLETSPEEPLFIWGFHALWHGEMSRTRINAHASDRPIIVWHRSFHELYMNDGALALLDLQQDAIRPGTQIDYARGHFYENGLSFAINRLNRWLLAPEKYEAGLERLKQVVHAGGHTTIGDMATGIFNFDLELSGLKKVLEGDNVPFRTRLVPHGAAIAAKAGSPEDGVALTESLTEHNTHRLSFSRQIKLFSDGAFFSQLAQLQPPGYIDGHHGEWLNPPEILERHVRAYWQAGFRIHVHVTGDLGAELTLDILEKMQAEKPRFNHGFTFEHFGFSTPEQIKRICALGANVSANVYYLHELSDIYAREGIGFERASQMARLGSCFREGITTTVHSDFTMAPAEPLNSAWVAVNRINHAGDVMAPEERLTPYQALAAITINAAHVLGMENEIGSIRAGKRADFTVLNEDPLTAPAERLNELEIAATVFEGEVFPL